MQTVYLLSKQLQNQQSSFCKSHYLKSQCKAVKLKRLRICTETPTNYITDATLTINVKDRKLEGIGNIHPNQFDDMPVTYIIIYLRYVHHRNIKVDTSSDMHHAHAYRYGYRHRYSHVLYTQFPLRMRSKHNMWCRFRVLAQKTSCFQNSPHSQP